MSMVGTLRLADPAEVLRLLREPQQIEDFVAGEVNGADVLDIEKAWHGLHFLFTGTAWEGTPPLNFVIAGTEVGDVDVGYGPARAFTAPELKAIAAALGKLDEKTLRARYDPAAMDRLEVYPNGWSEISDVDGIDWLIDAFEQVKSLVQRGAQSGKGMLIWLS